MEILFPFLNERPYLNLPVNSLGWLALFLLGGILAILLWRNRNKGLLSRELGMLAVMSVASAVMGLILGVRLPLLGALPQPGLPVATAPPVLLIFAAVPWLLAAGMLGPISAAIVAAIGAGFSALLIQHSVFYPLQVALVACIVSLALRQRFRGMLFGALRHPLAAAILATLVFGLSDFLVRLLNSDGLLPSRLDYAISNIPAYGLAFGGTALLAGLIGEGVLFFRISGWGASGDLQPSPAETSLAARLLYILVPFLLLLALGLMVGDWLIVNNTAENMLRQRMQTAAVAASEGIPYFLEVGQDLVQQMAADERLLDASPAEARQLLSEATRRVPFFSQFYLLDNQAQLITGYPENTRANQPLEETVGVDLALQGVRIQSYTIPPQNGGNTAQVSFLASVAGPGSRIDRVLIGRVDISTNPFMQPVLANLASLTELGGQGYLLDEEGRILYHPLSALVMTPYDGALDTLNPFQQITASDGTRSYQYLQQALGRPWAVVLNVPASTVQQMAVNMASPLVILVVGMIAASVPVMLISIRSVTNALKSLALETERIARGQLDHPLTVDGVDEAGQLRRSFEIMRRSLKARLDELNRLLEVSQGVARTLELEEAVRPVMAAMVASGAASARIVLDANLMSDADRRAASLNSAYGSGPMQGAYAYLDDQILALTRQQEQIILTNPGRVRMLNLTGDHRPQAIFAMALRHENQNFGALWIAYQQPHPFPEEEVRFFSTLAGQAALALANARLFLTAEIGRQRMEAILSSTPDPVLVTDPENRLLLFNPAAQQVLGGQADLVYGRDISQALPHGDLVEILRIRDQQPRSAEIHLADDRIYLAIASPIQMNELQLGRICILRDVTSFKELDTLKSEFVSTVSHDLRSPLTLIRGYATMLQMVGEMNEQQTSYVRKILSGIETMSRLVNNLLDLSRIEAGVGLQLEPTPVAEVLEQVVGSLQLQAAQKQINLALHTPGDGPWVVEADSALLQQAMQNLVENAIKYTEPGGKVDVRFEVRQDNGLFTVTDTGIGIAPVDQARLFEKFYRVARKGALQQRGTGLGLAIVKSIAERHNGRVWVESQLGRGSRFSFLIPLKYRRDPEEITRRTGQGKG